MIEFINKLLNTDLEETSANEKANFIAEILTKLFDYITKVMGI